MTDAESTTDSSGAAQVERRRRLRREATDTESLLWRLLRGRQLAGEKFRRQHQVGPYILDFYCPSKKMAIEADGGQHLSAEGLAKDAQRTRYLQDRGIRVLRFSNRDVLLEAEGVLYVIAGALKGEASP